MSEQERTGWRDEKFSNHRRSWGKDLPAVDLDSFGLDDEFDTKTGKQTSFNMVEYDQRMPRVLVEYKKFGGESFDSYKKSANGETMRNLATGYRSSLPFLFVVYWEDSWTMNVYRVNEAAKQNFGRDGLMSEYVYVSGLYRQRNRQVPADVAMFLNREIDEKAVIVPTNIISFNSRW